MNPVHLIQRILFSTGKVHVGHRAVRHLIAGGIGTVLYLASAAFLVEIGGLHPITSVIVSSLLLDVYTYALSRSWVYEPTMTHSYAVPRFVFVIVLALALNAGIMHLAVNILNLWYVWGLALATLIVPTTNFLLSYYWAFR